VNTKYQQGNAFLAKGGERRGTNSLRGALIKETLSFGVKSLHHGYFFIKLKQGASDSGQGSRGPEGFNFAMQGLDSALKCSGSSREPI